MNFAFLPAGRWFTSNMEKSGASDDLNIAILVKTLGVLNVTFVVPDSPECHGQNIGPLWRIVDNPEILAMHIGNSACPYTMCGSDKWFVLYIYPIGSMYGIHANIWGILMVNATIYSIHGSYGK